MSDDDSSSEDEDYKPNNAEVNEAEADSKGQKRKRLEGEGGSKVICSLATTIQEHRAGERMGYRRIEKLPCMPSF